MYRTNIYSRTGPNTAIWKFPLKITDEQDIMMPSGAEILSVAEQGDGRTYGQLCLWAIVDPKARMEPRKIFVVETGSPMPIDPRSFIGTVVSRPLVWHVFEL